MPTRNWKAEPCPCGHQSCRSWMVRPVVMLQGAIDSEADARLIAAAPELLALLQRWRALDAGAWHADRLARERADLEKTTDRLLAALAKAHGES